MDNVISIAAARTQRLKRALEAHGRNGGATIIETNAGSISAEKINCRDGFVEILGSFSEYFVVDYGDIRSFRSAAVVQTSVVNERGEFLPVCNPVAVPRPVAILPFARRQSSK